MSLTCLPAYLPTYLPAYLPAYVRTSLYIQLTSFCHVLSISVKPSFPLFIQTAYVPACTRRPSSAVARDPVWITDRRPNTNFIVNQWSYHDSDLSQVTDPDSVSRHGQILGQFNNTTDSTFGPPFNPSSTSSPRPSSSRHTTTRPLLLQARHVQLAMSQSTQQLDASIDESVFESASSATNPAFQDDIDEMEMRVNASNNDSDGEVIIFQRVATSPV